MTRRAWTTGQLREIERRWHSETLPEIAADLGVPVGTLKSALSRQGIRCPVRNPKGRRRRFGPVDQHERDARRRWYRAYRALRVEGVPAPKAVAQLRARGCDLTRHQLTCGWWHYHRTHLNDEEKTMTSSDYYERKSAERTAIVAKRHAALRAILEEHPDLTDREISPLMAAAGHAAATVTIRHDRSALGIPNAHKRRVAELRDLMARYPDLTVAELLDVMVADGWRISLHTVRKEFAAVRGA